MHTADQLLYTVDGNNAIRMMDILSMHLHS